MSAEPETRRSARATKGQHKALEQLDQPFELPKKRGNKKGKKAAPEPEEEPEEVIRCVCGATEQDEDSEEAWIACDECGVWQHNICVGLSRFEDECPENYWCEQCRPENHKVLLDGMARGEKPWENWRRIAEEEIAREKRDKKKGSKKGKAKRVSDERKPSPVPEPKKAKPSPAPENKKSKVSPAPVVDNKKVKPSPAPETSKKEPKAQVAASKRKVRDESQDKEPKKVRKLSETQTVPVPPVPALPKYTPPEDLAAKISDLSPDSRQGPAKALSKSLTSSIGTAEKKGLYVASDGVSVGARAERFALQIERAVHDSHPNFAAYTAQIKTLVFNLKNNQELAVGLLNGTLTPLALAGMTTEELASKELQKETAEMKARAEKQSILINEEGPRVRRTHKGEEIVGEDYPVTVDDAPPPVRRATIVRETTSESARPAVDEDEQTTDNEPHVELPAHIEQSAPPPRAPLQVDTKQQQQQSPKTDFDINKVFSSVKSPTATAQRRPSALPIGGPGVDPEVDRMLQDDGTESPPYSPTEENDADVVWKGSLLMNTVAELPVVAKYVGGAKLNETIGLPWTTLIPQKLSVAGRIDETKATEYLCSLRYSAPTDIVVVSLEPTSKSAKTALLRIIDYFVSKKRYGVVGEKGVGQVRDTYLIPVMPGTGGHPEFILNLEDNYLPQTRTEPMMLCVFVYRNDPSTMQRQHGTNTSGQPVSQSPVANTPTPPQGAFAPRHPSMSAPQFSPTSPQGTFPPQNQPPVRNGQSLPGPSGPQSTPLQAPQPPQQQQPAPQNGMAIPQDAQGHGERVARQILGELIDSPTVHFLLPHASRMQPKEWELVRDVYLRDPAARTDLNQLSALLAKESSARNAERGPGTQQQSPPQQHQQQSPPQPQHHGPPPSAQGQAQPQPPAQLRAPTAQQQTPIPPPPVPRQTPIPPPQIPRQTPIPPPQVPQPHAPPPAPTA